MNTFLNHKMIVRHNYIDTQRIYLRAIPNPNIRTVSVPQSVVVWMGNPNSRKKREALLDMRNQLRLHLHHLLPYSKTRLNHKYATASFKRLFGRTYKPSHFPDHTSRIPYMGKLICFSLS